MRFHLPLVTLLALSLPGVATAQLQWLSSPAPNSEVQQASHSSPTATPVTQRTKAKAPKTPKTMAAQTRTAKSAQGPQAQQTKAQPSNRRVMAASKRARRQAPQAESAPADLQHVSSLADY